MIDPDFPTTLPAFQNRFSDEETCLDYLRRQKWPEGFRCPKCEHTRSWTLHTRRVEECAACGHQTSLTAGTMFHGTRKPLSLWFRAVFEFVSRKHGCNAMDLQRLLGLSRKIAWAWLHKIRDAMVDPDRKLLSGTVQIDETMIGASEEGVYGRNRGSKKHLIVGAVEEQGRACGRARLAPVGCASQEMLQYWVSNNVAEGSHARTDGLKGYRGLEHAYEHDVDVIGKDGRKAVEKFPHIHLVFALFKRVVESTYQGSVSPKYLKTYCNEFVFRFNRRRAKSRTHLLQRVLENAVRRQARVHIFARRDDITAMVA
jgi:Zn ribbon nucleic-acid-binding protein